MVIWDDPLYVILGIFQSATWQWNVVKVSLLNDMADQVADDQILLGTQFLSSF